MTCCEKVRIGKGGRVVIPARFRKQLQLKVGDELNIRTEDNVLSLSSSKHSLAKAQNLVRHYVKCKNLVEKLNAMRREEVRHE